MNDETLYLYSSHIDGSYFLADEYCGRGVCPQCGDTDTLEYVGTYDEILSYLEEDIRIAQQNYNAVKSVLDKYMARQAITFL